MSNDSLDPPNSETLLHINERKGIFPWVKDSSSLALEMLYEGDICE